MMEFDRLFVEQTRLIFPPDLRLVGRILDRDALVYAPSWLAWLYRYLPMRVSWHRGRGFDAQRPAFYLWSVWAFRWHVAWLPARRAAWHRSTLYVSLGQRIWHIPWGSDWCIAHQRPERAGTP